MKCKFIFIKNNFNLDLKTNNLILNIIGYKYQTLISEKYVRSTIISILFCSQRKSLVCYWLYIIISFATFFHCFEYSFHSVLIQHKCLNELITWLPGENETFIKKIKSRLFNTYFNSTDMLRHMSKYAGNTN